MLTKIKPVVTQRSMKGRLTGYHDSVHAVSMSGASPIIHVSGKADNQSTLSQCLTVLRLLG